MSTKERLLIAAREILEEEGLDGIVVRAVAKRAGVSTMAMYRHYPDKDALVDALMADGFAGWEAIVRRIDEADPVAWLRCLLRAFKDFALTERHRFDAAFLMRSRAARTYPLDMTAGRSFLISAMMAKVEAGQAAGALQSGPPLDLVLTLSATAQGLVSMERAGRFSTPEDFSADYLRTMELVLAGLLTNNRKGALS